MAEEVGKNETQAAQADREANFETNGQGYSQENFGNKLPTNEDEKFGRNLLREVGGNN
jgi:hypothetical protein